MDTAAAIDDEGKVTHMSDDEEEGGVEADYDATLQTEGGSRLDDDAQKCALICRHYVKLLVQCNSSKLHPRNIDAYWIQRSIAKFIDDPIVSQQRSKEVLDILQVFL